MLTNYFAEITIDVILSGQPIDPEIYHSSEVKEALNKDGYEFLGWVNNGIEVPELPFTRVYKTRNGSTTIMANHEHRMYYCVDMGD